MFKLIYFDLEHGLWSLQTKKALSRNKLDRDKTKNKHYEQTSLRFSVREKASFFLGNGFIKGEKEMSNKKREKIPQHLFWGTKQKL